MFNEEVPKNIKSFPNPCKNRKCSLQLYIKYTDLQKNVKTVYTYTCSDPKIYAICLRWVDPLKLATVEEVQKRPQKADDLQPEHPAVTQRKEG